MKTLAQELSTAQIAVKVGAFRLKNDLFPRPCPVHVNSARYRGTGIAIHADGEPADWLAVMLENGKTWYYPIEDCQRIPWGKLHPADRRAWLRRHGYPLRAQHGPRRPLP